VLDPDDAKVDELKAELDRRGIPYDAKAKKADLVAVLAEADDPPAPPAPEPDPVLPDTVPADTGDAN
jgi:hypothetical protein